MPGHRIMKPLRYVHLSAIQCIMNCVLKADPAISISGSIEARKQLQFDLLIATYLLYDIKFERIKESFHDGTDYRCDC